ncbi:MAG TPA: hypothetical protein VEC99_11915 [Clostridia bacterium]|nr:hypothetical protein [Clostridia bacterium]
MKETNSENSTSPNTFKFYLGALDGGDWCEVAWEDKTLWYRAGVLFRELPSREVSCTPSPDRWRRFWQDLDRVGVWNWKPDYTDPNVLDGSGWHLEIKHAGRELKTGGDNGYPGANGPEYSPDTPFGQFLVALEHLTGIPGIV